MAKTYSYKFLTKDEQLIAACENSLRLFNLSQYNLKFTYFHYYNINKRSKEKTRIFCKARPLKQIAGHLLHRIMHKDLATFLLSLSPGNILVKISACDLNKYGRVRRNDNFFPNTFNLDLCINAYTFYPRMSLNLLGNPFRKCVPTIHI